MSFPASFYLNINYPFSQPCLAYINMKTSFWHTYAHSNNLENLPIKLLKKGFIKLLKEAWEQYCYLKNRNFVMTK